MTDGWCDPAFAGVRDVLADSLAAGDELGAAVCAYVDGRCVVDVWGGIADKRSGRPWDRDTRCVTFSCTKAVTATAALLLAERGAVSLEGRVTDWWPQFGANGKEATTGVHLLSHQAGLPAFDRPISVLEAADHDAMAVQLAGQAPDWPPGTAHGYHALTFGWLVGELVRRHSGRSVRDFVRAELGPELWVGVPPDMVAELARISAGRPGKGVGVALTHEQLSALVTAVGDPNSPMQRSSGNPAGSFNDPALLTAGWPAAGLVCTGWALADFYRRLVGGEILRSDTLRDAVKERVRGPDRTIVLDSAFGLGFMLPSMSMHLPEAAQRSAFGHPGASGSLGIGDLDCRLAFAYLTNMTRPAVGDRRAFRLVEALYAAL
jgi:CubicO group peptidase (beta-lactamase class C family)